MSKATRRIRLIVLAAIALQGCDGPSHAPASGDPSARDFPGASKGGPGRRPAFARRLRRSARRGPARGAFGPGSTD